MEASLSLGRASAPPWRFTFLIKLLALAALTALADRLFFRAEMVGATLGIFAFALLFSIVALRPDLRRDRRALLAAAAAGWFAFWLIEDPGPLGLALGWAALSMAALLPRAARFGSGLRWAQRLLLHSLTVPGRLPFDLSRLNRARRRRPSRLNLPAAAATLVLPVLGTALFLGLFAQANPLIGDAVGDVDLFFLLSAFSPLRLLFWLLIALLVWALLSPWMTLRHHRAAPEDAAINLPGISMASVTISLIAFNALFALQNGLDLAFLWSGAPLPQGMTLAEYAHRGAYPLIGTALLAGGFVLLTTRPGTEMAASRLIRRLVYLWIAQNVFLVASTMLRTLDYIDQYLLTELRIQALVWMALVAVGLLLICARLALGRSSVWLVNANMAAAALVLSASVAVDYDRIAAGWNVRHAREVGGRGTALDLCYLNYMGDSALLPLLALEQRPLRPEMRDKVVWVRTAIMTQLEARQARWDGWDWRGARRLAEARKLVADRRLPRNTDRKRDCNGRAFPPVEAAPPPAAPAPLPPLTAEKER